MNTAQYHRGPDEGGMYWNEANQVGLAMRRLAIVDLAEGHQPMTNEVNSMYIVYNGEIFNSGKLRKELISLGHIFKTHSSDTEVIVHGYEQWGTDVLSHLNGMFTFAIYELAMCTSPTNYI